MTISITMITQTLQQQSLYSESHMIPGNNKYKRQQN